MKQSLVKLVAAALACLPAAGSPASDQTVVNRPAASRELIARLSAAHPFSVVPQIVARQPGDTRTEQQRIDAYRAALVRFDTESAAALRDHPDDPAIIVLRSRFLRLVGRADEAIALLRPVIDDPAAFVRQSSGGGVLVGEAATLLAGENRLADLRRISAALGAVDMRANPHLLRPVLDFADAIWGMGRPQEAINYLNAFVPAANRVANQRGFMEFAAIQLCAYHDLGEVGRVNRLLLDMSRLRRHHPSAMMTAYMCTGRLDRAEELMIERLRGENGLDLVASLQNFERPFARLRRHQDLERIMRELRDRPAVRAAIDRIGVILPLPTQ